ncbi:hypothetical protein GPECTOR_30g170 [Gonium pectorale]|uniref:SET domain-containing protein n=1 Tax=Gonium pectorale TaxID=33097 RepID=A0A150GES9_GONPE|nr:hypothetical protein GPECTOR_30g170 [Gonium pectorale]|eukprot:KXZ48075.1 hypothetical protein GPECTOR_30g170 [Gonium pectorale]
MPDTERAFSGLHLRRDDNAAYWWLSGAEELVAHLLGPSAATSPAELLLFRLADGSLAVSPAPKAEPESHHQCTSGISTSGEHGSGAGPGLGAMDPSSNPSAPDGGSDPAGGSGAVVRPAPAPHDYFIARWSRCELSLRIAAAEAAFGPQYSRLVLYGTGLLDVRVHIRGPDGGLLPCDGAVLRKYACGQVRLARITRVVRESLGLTARKGWLRLSVLQPGGEALLELASEVPQEAGPQSGLPAEPKGQHQPRPKAGVNSASEGDGDEHESVEYGSERGEDTPASSDSEDEDSDSTDLDSTDFDSTDSDSTARAAFPQQAAALRANGGMKRGRSGGEPLDAKLEYLPRGGGVGDGQPRTLPVKLALTAGNFRLNGAGDAVRAIGAVDCKYLRLVVQPGRTPRLEKLPSRPKRLRGARSPHGSEDGAAEYEEDAVDELPSAFGSDGDDGDGSLARDGGEAAGAGDSRGKGAVAAAALSDGPRHYLASAGGPLKPYSAKLRLRRDGKRARLSGLKVLFQDLGILGRRRRLQLRLHGLVPGGQDASGGSSGGRVVVLVELLPEPEAAEGARSGSTGASNVDKRLSRAVVCNKLARLLGLEGDDGCPDAQLPEGPVVLEGALEPCGDPARGGAGLQAALPITENEVLGVVGGYVMPTGAAEYFTSSGHEQCPSAARLARVVAGTGADVATAWRLLAGAFRLPLPAGFVERKGSYGCEAPAPTELSMLGYGNLTALVNDPRVDPRAWRAGNDVDSQEAAGKANCAVVPVCVCGLVLPVLVALRDIGPGEQLLRDYGAGWWRDLAAVWEVAEDNGLDVARLLHAAANSDTTSAGAGHASQLEPVKRAAARGSDCGGETA